MHSIGVYADFIDHNSCEITPITPKPMNTIERLTKGCSPLPWRVATRQDGYYESAIFASQRVGKKPGRPKERDLLIAQLHPYTDCEADSEANAAYIVKIANAGPRLVEFVSRFAESFGQVESQLDSPELEMLQDARSILKDVLGDDDQTKRSYMQRSMRETRKK